MDHVGNEMTFLAGAVAGAAGLGCVWAFGPAIASTGWTSVAAAGGLAAAACWTYIRKEAGVVPAVKRGPTKPLSGPDALRQSETPGEWLSRVGADADESLPEPERRGYLRGRLGGCLTPIPADWAEPGSIKLSGHVRWLAVAFAALAAGRRKEARQLIDELAAVHGSKSHVRAAPHGTDGRIHAAVPLSRVATLVADPKVAGLLADATLSHGTVETAMMHLLGQARVSGGILATSEFLWLKGIDRPLWYALGNLGRSTYLVEGLAAMAHYRAEKGLGGSSREPLVDAAVEALLALPPAADTTPAGHLPSRTPGKVALP